MRVVLQGSLEHFPPRELLAFLAATHNGTFDAESGGERVRLALRDGKVLGAEGDVDAVGVMVKLLAWSDGTFSFLDDVVLPEIDAQELASLIASAEERVIFPDDAVKFRVVNRPPGEISLTAEEFQVLFQIGTGKSPAQLRAETGRAAADLYPIIKRLQTTGLIERVTDTDDTAPHAKVRTSPPPHVPEPPPFLGAPEPPPAAVTKKTTEAPHMVA